MRFINRTAVAAPPSLAAYLPTTHSWDEEPGKARFGGDDKRALRNALEALQNGCCAYCEAATYGNGHIEHFRRKNPADFPELMFDWKNLFLSCDADDSCGRYKDRKGTPYNPSDLVKPDEDDPNDFFYFHEQGEIRVRSGIDARAEHRALETIRVFHLDCGRMAASRRRAVEQYRRKTPGLLEDLMAVEEGDRVAYIDLELAATRNEPHSAVIRHLFEKLE